jgi:nitroreductase
MGTHELTRDVWDIDPGDFPEDGSTAAQARFLLRYAILAPSSHNSQPWEFVVEDDTIEIHAAEDRWLDVTDPDRRELYLSLGCAIENLSVAAEHFGTGVDIVYHDDTSPAAVVSLQPSGEPSSRRPAGLFGAITERFTNHHLFEDDPLEEVVRQRLRECALEDSVTAVLVDDADAKRSVAELQAEADRRQMEDPEYRNELGHWIGIGALGDGWLKARIGQAVVAHLDIGDREARKNSKLVQSAPVLGVLVTDSDDPSARVTAGQVFERMSLAATGEGVAVHPMSQTLERPEMRETLADIVDADGALPQHLFRLGYAGAEQEHTPRWPLEKFLVETN